MVAFRIGTPIGDLLIAVDGQSGALRRLEFEDGRGADALIQQAGGELSREVPASGTEVAQQLADYFAGKRRAFDLLLAPHGTAFQRRVWEALVEIPHGQTVSYGALAERLGSPGAVRAVGRANGQNPIAIVVPCHRVIGADGSLTGYGGGIWRKRALLELEGATVPAQQMALL